MHDTAVDHSLSPCEGTPAGHKSSGEQLCSPAAGNLAHGHGDGQVTQGVVEQSGGAHLCSPAARHPAHDHVDGQVAEGVVRQSGGA